MKESLLSKNRRLKYIGQDIEYSIRYIIRLYFFVTKQMDVMATVVLTSESDYNGPTAHKKGQPASHHAAISGIVSCVI